MSFKKNTTRLDDAINELFDVLQRLEPDTPEYDKVSNQLEKLYQIQANVKTGKDRLSKDTLAMVIGNLAGILLIVNYERLDVITTKAFSLILKAK